VYDRATRRLLYEWTLKPLSGNFPMALDEAHKRLYIGTRKPPGMAVMETEAGKVIAIMNACGDTDDLFYQPSARLIYLTGGRDASTCSGRAKPTITTESRKPRPIRARVPHCWCRRRIGYMWRYRKAAPARRRS